MTFIYFKGKSDLFGQEVDMTRCRASVAERGRGVRSYQCSRRGLLKGTKNKKIYLFCKQHHPDIVAEREAKKDAAYDKEWKTRNDRWERQALERELCRDVTNKELQDLGPGWLRAYIDGRIK